MATGAIFLTDQSSGAPALTGQNGSACGVLDWALVQKGWEIEYTAANSRVYRPGAGNRRRLFIAHDSAISGDARGATIRGCEDASSATVGGLVNPFPTLSQQSNSNSSIRFSSVANATPRPYRIVLSETFLLFAASNDSANTSSWDFFFFGDLAGVEPGDVWATAIHVGGAPLPNTPSQRAMSSCMSSGFPGSAAKTYFCRNIDGTAISSLACLGGSVSSSIASLGSVPGAAAMRAGYGNRIIREKVAVRDFGGAAAAIGGMQIGGMQIFQRGWVPNFWNPIHPNIGTVTSDDSHTDSSYSPGSLFFVIPASSTVALILEASDTWSPPNG